MTQFVVHPGFYARYQGDDWANNLAIWALGRPARPDEVLGVRPLQQVWDSRYFCDSIVWWNGLTDNNGRRTGADLNCGENEFAVNFCHCIDSHGGPTCQSTVWGQPIDFGTDEMRQPDDG